MPKEQPLWQRLYTQPPLIDLARTVGYEGVPDPAFWDHYRALCKRYGQPAMDAAVREITAIDTPTTPAVARLPAAARPLCFQLLGPPRGDPGGARAQKSDPPLPPRNGPPGEAT